MTSAEKIVVVRTFDTPAMAGIAKAKLDAYGIPCFLSEENMGTLYPFTYAGFSGIRLHVFEQDLERVRELLEEEF